MKITVKFREKNGVAFSIETVSGRQFRCGVCGKLFFNRNELDKHLEKESIEKCSKLLFPKLDENISVTVLYTQDVRDRTNSKYPLLHKGDKLLNTKQLKLNGK